MWVANTSARINILLISSRDPNIVYQQGSSKQEKKKKLEKEKHSMNHL